LTKPNAPNGFGEAVSLWKTPCDKSTMPKLALPSAVIVVAQRGFAAMWEGQPMGAWVAQCGSPQCRAGF
jgi:hypothetical protein